MVVSYLSLHRSLAWRMVVPLVFTFGVMFSVAFDYLAQDLSVASPVRTVKWWHLLLIPSILGNIFMLTWYVLLNRVLAVKGQMAPSPIVVWSAIIWQALAFVASVLFIVGGATTWFTGDLVITSPIRIYTIIIGSFGTLAFLFSFVFGILVRRDSNKLMPDRDDDEEEETTPLNPNANYGSPNYQPAYPPPAHAVAAPTCSNNLVAAPPPSQAWSYQ